MHRPALRSSSGASLLDRAIESISLYGFFASVVRIRLANLSCALAVPLCDFYAQNPGSPQPCPRASVTNRRRRPARSAACRATVQSASRAVLIRSGSTAKRSPTCVRSAGTGTRRSRTFCGSESRIWRCASYQEPKLISPSEHLGLPQQSRLFERIADRRMRLPGSARGAFA